LAHFKPGEPRTRKREEAKLLFPTIKKVLDLRMQVIEESGGAHGLRDEAALESALMAATAPIVKALVRRTAQRLMHFT
jgi:hypothetical protein